MSTLVAQTISNGTVSTSSANVIQGSAKAWVNFNGTGTVAIRASYNVSSITDNGTGSYTVNFTNAMLDANYSAVLSTSNTATNSTILVISNAVPPTTASLRVLAFNSSNGGAVDEAFNSVAIFD